MNNYLCSTKTEMRDTMRKKEQPAELTRAELEVMQIVWRLNEAFLGEVVDAFQEPRPAYTCGLLPNVSVASPSVAPAGRSASLSTATIGTLMAV